MASAAPPPDEVDSEGPDPEGVVYLLAALCDPSGVEGIVGVSCSVGGVPRRAGGLAHGYYCSAFQAVRMGSHAESPHWGSTLEATSYLCSGRLAWVRPQDAPAY